MTTSVSMATAGRFPKMPNAEIKSSDWLGSDFMNLEHDTTTRTLTATLSQSELEALNFADLPAETELGKRGRVIKRVIRDELLRIQSSIGQGVSVKIILPNDEAHRRLSQSTDEK